MSSISLERFQSRHPRERDAISRLEDFIRKGFGGVFTLDQLADRIEAKSRDELAIILGELASAGVVLFKLQIRSPKTNEPIGDYSRLSDIPPRVKDVSTGLSFDVDMEQVEPVYTISGKPK